MPSEASAETIASQGCRVVVRRVDGASARELFLLAEPTEVGVDAGAQAGSVYRAIDALLAGEGASWADVLRETVFLASHTRDLDDVRAARQRVVGASGLPPLEIEQPPLEEGARLLTSIHCRVPQPGAKGASAEVVRIADVGSSGDGSAAVAVRRATDDGCRLDCAAVLGRGEGALAQTRSAFAQAEALLERAGLDFGDVVRTWIHLRDIDRDYDALNEGRRAFFTEQGITSPPASTGIGGGPSAPAHDLCLGFEAIRRDGGRETSVMHAATLNEAPEYGADFVRGLRVVGENGTLLHVSGTASVDEAGRTAHPGDFDAQAERMLLNVRTLLEGQGAGFGDVVSAITYVKHRADADRLGEALARAGFSGFPHALVEAPVCRPDLLCETEAIAFLPNDAA